MKKPSWINCIALMGALPLLMITGPVQAGCLNGSCHQSLTSTRHLHGPVAAEMAGANGCVVCHQPAGPACRPEHGGKFAFKKKGKEMCRLCHGDGVATEHTSTEQKCLQCHDPHGSDQSPYMLRNDR